MKNAESIMAAFHNCCLVEENNHFTELYHYDTTFALVYKPTSSCIRIMIYKAYVYQFKLFGTHGPQTNCAKFCGPQT